MKLMQLSRLDRINILLAAFVVILVWANPLFKQQKSDAVFNLNPDKITEIRITKNNRLQIALLRSKQGWQITHPVIEPSTPKKVGILFSLLSVRSDMRLSAKQQNLKNFGFSAKNLQISFNQQQLQFGAINKTTGQRYVLYNNTISLIDDSYFRIVSLPAQYYKN